MIYFNKTPFQTKITKWKKKSIMHNVNSPSSLNFKKFKEFKKQILKLCKDTTDVKNQYKNWQYD